MTDILTGCSISDTNTYSVSVTVTTGTDLNMYVLVSAFLSSSL